MKKKLLSVFLFLVFVLSIGAMSACDRKKTETRTIVLWHYYNDAQEIALNELIDVFNNGVGKEKGIAVKAYSKISIEGVSQQVLDSVTGAPGAEAMPNMFMAYADTAYRVDKLGKVASLDAYFTAEELEDYVGGFLDEGRFDGKNLKIFPVAKSTEIMMLNLNEWDKLKLENPNKFFRDKYGNYYKDSNGNEIKEEDHLKTVEGVVKVAELYYNWSGGKAFYGRDSMSNYFVASYKSLGKELMYREPNGNFAVEFDEAILKKLWDNYYVPYVKGYFYSGGRWRSSDVGSGSIIAYTGSTSASVHFPANVKIDDQHRGDIMHLTLRAPLFEGGQDIAVQQGAGIVVSKTDAATERACAEFLKWFTSGEVNMQFSVSSSYMPVRKSLLIGEDFKPETYTDDKRISDALTVSAQIVKNSTMYTNIPSEYGAAVRAVLDTHLEKFAKDAKAVYDQSVKEGKTRAEALAPLISQEAFESWFADFQIKVKEAYGG